MTMTPDWAESLIQKHNLRNRKLRKHVLERYKEAIRAGRYKLTHQGVAIGWDGVLLDGQHRLLAVAETGMSIQIVYATQCDPATFDVIDSGCVRKSSDALDMNNVPYANTVNAICRMHIMYYEHLERIWQGRLRYPETSEITKFYMSRSNDCDFATQKAYATWRQFRLLTNRSAIGAFVLLAIDNNHPRTEIEAFLQKLGSGSGLDESSPILRFRAAVANGVLNRKGTNKGQLTLAGMLKCFNSAYEGKTTSVFRFPEIPPMPVILPCRKAVIDGYKPSRDGLDSQ